MRIKKRWRRYFLDTSKTTASFQGAVFSSEIGKKKSTLSVEEMHT